MPIVQKSSYQAPFWLCGGHMQTIHPALFRKTLPLKMLQERLELSDGDFLDLEWTALKSKRLAILSHGLEGSSQAPYMLAMARALVKRGWDVLAWNFRSCSHELNRLPSFYHSGKTEDLSAVISYAQRRHPAEQIDLLGFSLGGNLTLKYLGERGSAISEKIHRAVAFSAPCDLACSAAKLAEGANGIYMARFLKSLRKKIRRKHQYFPELFDLSGLDEMRTFAEFDDRYTAPLHGFLHAQDYWQRSSSRPFLPEIRVPTLLINARNDPFLGSNCFPYGEAELSSFFYFDCPAEGGHMGFGAGQEYWSELRAIEFLSGDLNEA